VTGPRTMPAFARWPPELPRVFAKNDDEPCEHAKDSGIAKQPGRSSCILLIEDNPVDVLLVQESLEEHGIDCDLLVLTDGERAIAHLDEVDSKGELSCPALIILDLNLPRRNGREVLKRVRGSGKCGNVPVVVLSSSDAQQDKQDAAQLGAQLYIRKPLNLEEFMSIGAKLKMLLANSSAAE
jgi:CheY-like chemotaxis protein